jgi:CubicO group peptidase (beta-lactamase class C family)
MIVNPIPSVLASVAAAGLIAVSCPAVAAPRTAAERVAQDYLEVFDRGDRAAYAAFVHAHWPTFNPAEDEFAGLMDRNRDQSGGYDRVEDDRADDSSVAEIVKSRLSDDYFRLDLQVAASADHPIERLTLTPIERPADVPPPPRLSNAALIRLVNRNINAMGDFSGAVLIARRGRVIYTRAGGLANLERDVPNTVATRFGMASMGKMFTAVAIMQLVQAGKIDLNAPIGKYLTDYPNAETAHAVTIAQLLTHTGGTGDFFSKKWADNIARLKTPADYVAMFGTKPPAFPPGSKFDYSNFGYVILGRIVEVVSGQTYETYLRDHVFRPAGMAHSGLNGPPDAPSTRARSYVKANMPKPPPAMLNGPATPAGGAYSTVGDMLEFAKALDTQVLLDKAHTERMITPQVEGDEGPDGYGFQLRGAGGVRDVGHDGGGPGENGGFRILNDGAAVIVVLSNVAPTWRADKLCRFIAARVELAD